MNDSRIQDEAAQSRCAVESWLGQASAALEEARLIVSRHDGVHVVHGLLSCVLNIKSHAARGYYDAGMKTHMESVMARLRRIDRTGFDQPERPNTKFSNAVNGARTQNPAT